MEAQWYDEALAGSRAMAPLDESSALPVYHAARAFVDESLPVIDLGCGTGRFAMSLVPCVDAKSLLAKGLRPYQGYDFAPAVVDEARRYCGRYELDFEVADIREWEHGPDLPEECTYVLLEVLEHLDDDRDALERIPAGLPVVFSVPNFWSASHVRTFAQPRDAFDRYADLLNFHAWQALEFPMLGRRIHVFSATTRADRL